MYGMKMLEFSGSSEQKYIKQWANSADGKGQSFPLSLVVSKSSTQFWTTFSLPRVRLEIRLTGAAVPQTMPFDESIFTDTYREYASKVLSEQDDRSVIIASIMIGPGFFDDLSVLSMVNRLVIMGGVYLSGWEYNFDVISPALTAHVVNTWGKMSFSGSYHGGNVTSGAQLTVQAPSTDPVAAV
ncbi:uncharacterized protein ARMOST_05664 [Armillaria ostoyae]|uniref:Uncharacterized protein n=1 Tax=Armillaria ostoyae TaxID=47428 RepID=A0A284R0T3_ARMOS|nr:uncharacterized protein ARMOST_05664 [Armillaria ostoyae]